MIEEHKKFLEKKVSEVDIKRVNSKFYRDILIKYGHWLVALLTRKVNPITPDQYDFIETFKKSRYKKFSSLPKNKFIAALYLWKGKNWVTSIALTLANENKSQKVLVNKNKKSANPIPVKWRKKRKEKIFGLESIKKGRKTRLEFSNESKREEIARLSKLKPPLKSKRNSKYLFPKLDPTRTYRWTDQGFQTREGHKVMSSKAYRNSKSK